MRRWAVVVFVVVIVTALILGGSLQIILSLLPGEQQQTILPFAAAVGITVLIANGVIAVMQWFGVSPLDYLPERTLADTLRKQDPHRFSLTKSKDAGFLAEQVKAAENQKQYAWVYVFADAWMKLRPHDEDAYESLGEALIELNNPQEAIVVGEKLTKLAPLNHEGYSIQGNAYKELGDKEQARIFYERALNVVTPTFRQFVLRDLAETYQGLGMLDEAIRVLEELLPLLDSHSTDYYDARLQYLREVKNRMAGK